MKKALFIDFEDSFSFNVVQELIEVGLMVEVISWKEFKTITYHDLLVLGPGPGHPNDYQNIFPLIRDWQKKNKKIFGVCLGHQILWSIEGLSIEPAVHPLHGQKIQMNLTLNWQKWLGLPEEIWVQRYSSLAVKSSTQGQVGENLVQEGEILMSRTPQFISYQFHPESVGTKCRQNFFWPILRDLL
jgi:anthranilate/para-aminobenzoate synthase component II